MIVFILSVLVISMNNYNQLDSSVRTKTNANMVIFIDSVFETVNHLDIILDTTKQILSENHIAIAKSIAHILDNPSADFSSEALKQIADPLGIIELNIVDSNGILIHSNVPENIGFDYKYFEKTSAYMALTDGTLTELSEEPRESALADGTYGQINHYTGVARAYGGFIQLGFNTEVLNRLNDKINVQTTIENTRLRENGYGIVLLNGVIKAHPNKALLGMDVSMESWYEAIHSNDGFGWMNIDNITYYSGYKNANGYIVLALIPQIEYINELHKIFVDTILFLTISLIIIIAIIYALINKLLSPIKQVTKSLGEIAGGNLDARVEGNFNDEFSLIKDAVNNMAEGVKTYLHEKLEAERIAHEAELARLALVDKVNYDALTKIYNRHYLDERLICLISTLRRSGAKFSVLMLDIDCFKKYNDTYGHAEGDKCLKAVAGAIRACITRVDDFAARYGGEEFTIVLPNTDQSGAEIIANKILENIRSLGIPHENSDVTDCVTVSIGATSGTVGDAVDAQSFIKRADEALYMAKQSGRDRCIFLSNNF